MKFPPHLYHSIMKAKGVDVLRLTGVRIIEELLLKGR
jgi:hypothetical protein